MAIFIDAKKKTDILEGGYADIKGDPGGKTMYGITEKVARSWGWQGEMKNLPRSLANKIYKKSYWDACRCDKMKWQEVAEQVYDHSVNCGFKTACKVLQKALNKYGLSIKVDGAVGKNTIKALNAVRHKAYFLSRLIDERELYYDRLVFLKPYRIKFIKSWRRRPVALLLMDAYE